MYNKIYNNKLTYKPEYFEPKEVVHPNILKELQKHPDYTEDMVWGLFDEGMLRVSDALRKKFGTTTINGIYKGQVFTNSGLRYNYGSRGSCHYMGKGFDWKFKNVKPKEVHEYILDNQEYFYSLGLRRLEDLEVTKTWVHGDSKNTLPTTPFGSIYVFKP